MKRQLGLALAVFVCLGVTYSLFAAPPGEGWVQLFNGKDLEGWEQRNGTATYKVEDGCVLGTTSEGSPNSFLCTKKDYGDFELVYEPENLHPGYGFKLRADIPAVIARVKSAAAGETVPDAGIWPSVASHYDTADELEAAVEEIAARDAETGKWVEDGWIRSQTFIDAVFTLGRYIDGRS